MTRATILPSFIACAVLLALCGCGGGANPSSEASDPALANEEAIDSTEQGLSCGPYQVVPPELADLYREWYCAAYPGCCSKKGPDMPMTLCKPPSVCRCGVYYCAWHSGYKCDVCKCKPCGADPSDAI